MYAPIPMVPGPVTVPMFVRDALACDYGSGSMEKDFIALYHATGQCLAQCMGTRHDVVIMTGEAMLALWAGLKSCLAPKDRVLSIVTGVFGEGIGQMAASFGCEVRTLRYAFDTTVGDLTAIEAAIAEFKPHMITAVHCETPSGTLNPLEGIGALKRRYNVPLFYVDAVASLGGVPVRMDAWEVDILLGGPQKCLSAPPNICFLGVSSTAWDCILQRGYEGYDALLPWRTVYKNGCPYTPYWHGIAALYASLQNIMHEGLEHVYARHERAAIMCREGIQKLGCSLWPVPLAVPSPTVTAAYIPQDFTWQQWQQNLREQGLVVGGSFGPMTNKVFRLGHMGSQAHSALVEQALRVMEKVLLRGIC